MKQPGSTSHANAHTSPLTRQSESNRSIDAIDLCKAIEVVRSLSAIRPAPPSTLPRSSSAAPCALVSGDISPCLTRPSSRLRTDSLESMKLSLGVCLPRADSDAALHLPGSVDIRDSHCPLRAMQKIRIGGAVTDCIDAFGSSGRTLPRDRLECDRLGRSWFRPFNLLSIGSLKRGRHGAILNGER
jgi:hypothetical protein